MAKAVGIDHVEADVLPDQKAAVDTRLPQEGARVAIRFAGNISQAIRHF